MDGVWVVEGKVIILKVMKGSMLMSLFFFKRNILPLPPLGLYSDPSMRLVIYFSHPNCLSFCLLFIRSIQSLLLERIFASGIRSITC